MTLPYRWHPDGTIHKYAFPRGQCEPDRVLAVGDVLPWEHAVYRIVDLRLRAEFEAVDRPVAVTLRPVALGDDPRDRDHDEHLLATRWRSWLVYPDPKHYPICSTCHEPVPCREAMAEEVAAAGSNRMNRYSLAGVCPACQEPVTDRQKSITYPDNIEVPVGPPVTFHTRRQCYSEAHSYEKRWVAGDPQNRPRTLSRPPCKGSVIAHNDGTYECTAWPACPGAHAEHSTMRCCDCTDCHARGSFHLGVLNNNPVHRGWIE